MIDSAWRACTSSTPPAHVVVQMIPGLRSQLKAWNDSIGVNDDEREEGDLLELAAPMMTGLRPRLQSATMSAKKESSAF
jgi:hypothetical protein